MKQVRISIITPSIRLERLAIVRKALKRQSFTDYEWLICSRFNPEISEAQWIKDDFQGGAWTLNRAYNKLFQKAQGELIVSLQDSIWVEASGLQAFWDDYLATGKKSVISGVGDQYEELDEYGKPQVKVWNDPRKTHKYGTFYECVWNDAEFNWAAIPASCFAAVGGFDEELDFLGYGGDQLQFCERLNDYGTKFYLNQTNESFTLRHNRDDFGGEEHWNANHLLFNGGYSKRKQELAASKLWPILQTNSKTAIKGGESKQYATN